MTLASSAGAFMACSSICLWDSLGLADVRPLLYGEVALAGLQDDHAGVAGGAELIGGVFREQALVAARELHPAHLLALGLTFDEHGAVLVLVRNGLAGV